MSKPEFIKKFVHAYGNKMKHHILMFLKWSLISLLVGIVVGGFSVLFAFIMNTMTEYRENNDFIIYLLPVAGIVTVFLYSVFKYKNDKGTNLVLSTIHAETEMDNYVLCLGHDMGMFWLCK